MGKRKNAVREPLKVAARKHKEGKPEDAEIYARRAGKAAAESGNGQAIDKAAKDLNLPGQIVSITQEEFLQYTLPRNPGPGRVVNRI